MASKAFHVHLVSDSTGETVVAVARACLAQFDDIQLVEHLWPLVRRRSEIRKILKGLKGTDSIVLYTMVDRNLQEVLDTGCRDLGVPCVPVLDPVLESLHVFLGRQVREAPGRQHEMDAEYFARIEAIHFVLDHDDGQLSEDLTTADVILAGVSRTLKTPTSIYLANRGIKAANVPIVPGFPFPEHLLGPDAPLVVGLTKDPKRLVEIRRNRLKILERDENDDYADIEMVSEELRYARELFEKFKWPTIDVTRRSVEEVAATILQLIQTRQERQP